MAELMMNELELLYTLKEAMLDNEHDERRKQELIEELAEISSTYIKIYEII